MADFWLRHKANIHYWQNAQLPDFNWIGLVLTAICFAAAYASPIMPARSR